jgi:hypothetical protein
MVWKSKIGGFGRRFKGGCDSVAAAISAARAPLSVAQRNLPKSLLDGAAARIHLAPAVATITHPVPEPLPPLIRWKFAWIFVAGIAFLIFTINDEKFLSP